MAKHLHIWLLILCLGLFVIPKQYFLGQNVGESCSAVSITQQDHCKSDIKAGHKSDHKSDSCHKDGKNKNHCTGNCNNCDICHFSIAVFQVPNHQEMPDLTVDFKNKKEDFSYVTPEFSSIFSKIWQPPKIG